MEQSVMSKRSNVDADSRRLCGSGRGTRGLVGALLLAALVTFLHAGSVLVKPGDDLQAVRLEQGGHAAFVERRLEDDANIMARGQRFARGQRPEHGIRIVRLQPQPGNDQQRDGLRREWAPESSRRCSSVEPALF